MKMEIKSFQEISKDSKILILEELGYQTDGVFVLDSCGDKVMDKYIDKPVQLDNMLILPGSTIILDDNPLSIISYIEEYGDVF